MPKLGQKNRKSKKSIKTWLIISFAVIIAFIIVGQTVFNLLLLEPLFIYRGKVAIEKSYYMVKDSYDGDADFSELNELAIKLDIKYGIKFTLLCEDGDIYSSEYTNFELEQQFGGAARDRGADSSLQDDSTEQQESQSAAPELPELENEGDEGAQDFSDFFTNFDIQTYTTQPNIEISDQERSGTAIVLKAKFSGSDSQDVYVRMSVSLESISSTVTLFTQISTVISAVALVIAIVIAVFLSRRIARQVVAVEGVAKRISELDFDCYADENVASKELASLAGSINSMSASLKQAIADLTVANRKLQKDLDYQKQVEKMQKEFIANVSHEMKTPLALLQVYSENLKNNVENIDKGYYCDVIIEETNNLNDMVRSLLDISSIENGLSKMHFEELNLSALCMDVANKFAPMLENFAFSNTVDANVVVSADRKYIEQAMKNYLSNAVNHTPEGASIELSLQKSENMAVFTVKNDGKNISDADLEHIWDAFYKSDKARTRTPGNNVGLGLYIVKTVIEKHAGTYGVRNTQTGVAFYFSLPLL